MAAPTNILSRLYKCRSFSLQRVSPTTFPQDVLVRHRRDGRYTRKELAVIADMLNSRSVFRCRIGRGRYFYGLTITEAVAAALRHKGGDDGQNVD